MEFQNKVVMVTGAAGSLGKAVAAAYSAAGASLVLVDVNAKVLAEAYHAEKAPHLCLAADLTDPASIRDAVSQAQGKFGPIDVLCNIAGGFRMGEPVHETSAETWALMMNMNTMTMLNTVQAVVPVMLANGGGKIVNIGAGAGQRGQAHMGAYSASKSVVIRLTESMAAELREQNINVNCVLPSIIDTPQNRADMPDADPKRWVAPTDLAQVILFLTSTSGRAIHGAALPVSGLS